MPKQVRCPKCGFIFQVYLERAKGAGARTAGPPRLGPLHERILSVLEEREAFDLKSGLPKRVISAILHDKGIKVSGNSLSGRLSELAGWGFIECGKRNGQYVWFIVKKP